MRHVIALAAFAAPLLILVAIGATCAEVPAVKPALPHAELAELRRFVQDHQALLDHYACRPGERETANAPHLELERFARRGIDPQGHPWYRLARPGPPCGVLRRIVPGQPLQVEDGMIPTLVMPLAGRWHYWEVRPPAVEAAAPAKNP